MCLRTIIIYYLLNLKILNINNNKKKVPEILSLFILIFLLLAVTPLRTFLSVGVNTGKHATMGSGQSGVSPALKAAAKMASKDVCNKEAAAWLKWPQSINTKYN